MKKSCEICERTSLKGNSKSHSQIRTRRWQGVNLQNKTIDGKKMKICTRCMRTRTKLQVLA